MKISLIVPIYFFNEYVETLVKSLQSQSSQDFEVVFVGNNVSATAFEIIGKQIESLLGNSKIERQYHHTSQPGANPSRKIGLTKSRYDYVLFMDCDDALAYDEVVEDFQKIAKKYDPDVISSNIQRAGLSDGNITLRDIIYTYKNPGKVLTYKADEWTVIKNYGTNIVARLIRKKCIEKIEFAGLPFFQDWNISSKFFPNFLTFYFHQKPTYLYVSRNESISQFHNQNRKDLEIAFNCIDDIHRYFKENNFDKSRSKFLYDKVLRFCFAYLYRCSFINDDAFGRKICKRFLAENGYSFRLWFLTQPKLLLIYLSIFNKRLHKIILRK